MNQEAKNWIVKIYQNYKPLSNIDQKLIGRAPETDFKSYVTKMVDHLPTGLQSRIMEELFGWGPLSPLLGKENLFDIIVQGPQKIFYETSEGLFQLEDHFACEKSFQNFVEFLLNQSGLLVNQKEPFGNGKVGNFRVHISLPPLSHEVSITLRRHRQKILSLKDLLESAFIHIKQKEFFERMIFEKRNFLVIGPTGSGKTTFLNALINEIKDLERLVIVEDTDEIQCSNPMACKLLSREICPDSLKPFDMGDLIKQSLRMRPDRLVIGEVRGAEAKDLLQALATGHSGSMGTLHAHSAQQAMIRLEMLIQMGAPHWSLHSIRQLIQLSLNDLIVLKEDRHNKGVAEICKISSHEKFGLLLEPQTFESPEQTTRPLSRAF